MVLDPCFVVGFLVFFFLFFSAGCWLCCRAEVVQRNWGQRIAECGEILWVRMEGCGRAPNDLWCYFIVYTFKITLYCFFSQWIWLFWAMFFLGQSQDSLLCSCLKPGTSPASLWINPGVSWGCSVLPPNQTDPKIAVELLALPNSGFCVTGKVPVWILRPLLCT